MRNFESRRISKAINWKLNSYVSVIVIASPGNAKPENHRTDRNCSADLPNGIGQLDEAAGSIFMSNPLTCQQNT